MEAQEKTDSIFTQFNKLKKRLEVIIDSHDDKEVIRTATKFLALVEREEKSFLLQHGEYDKRKRVLDKWITGENSEIYSSDPIFKDAENVDVAMENFIKETSYFVQTVCDGMDELLGAISDAEKFSRVEEEAKAEKENIEIPIDDEEPLQEEEDEFDRLLKEDENTLE